MEAQQPRVKRIMTQPIVSWNWGEESGDSPLVLNLNPRRRPSSSHLSPLSPALSLPFIRT